eukprot:247649-Pleurochrysis_carterae.AAC.6
MENGGNVAWESRVGRRANVHAPVLELVWRQPPLQLASPSAAQRLRTPHAQRLRTPHAPSPVAPSHSPARAAGLKTIHETHARATHAHTFQRAIACTAERPRTQRLRGKPTRTVRTHFTGRHLKGESDNAELTIDSSFDECS